MKSKILNQASFAQKVEILSVVLIIPFYLLSMMHRMKILSFKKVILSIIVKANLSFLLIQSLVNSYHTMNT